MREILAYLITLILLFSPFIAKGTEEYWVFNNNSSSGFIPFEKFKYLTEGMSEAEVLSRLGPPTKEVTDEVEVVGYSEKRGSLKRIVQIKRYYYIGNPELGERTTIIHFRNGIVEKIERIFPPKW